MEWVFFLMAAGAVALIAVCANNAGSSKEKFMAAYNSEKQSVDIPENAKTVYNREYRDCAFFAWIDNKRLSLFPKDPDELYRALLGKYGTMLKQILIEDILCYTQSGNMIADVQGSGGHSSFSVLTGFHGKINPVNISTTVEDQRSTQIFYEERNVSMALALKYDDFYVLKQIIPDKDYQVVEALRLKETNQEQSLITGNTNTLEERLKRLKSLHSDGVITDADFESKKKELLDSL